MPNFNSVPGAGGIAGIIGLTILASVAITLVTGETIHWIFIAFGIVMGLVAVKSINGR